MMTTELYKQRTDLWRH